MPEEDRLDIVEGMDEDGNRLLLTVEKYFFYNGDEYVLLREVAEEDRPREADRQTLYVMRVAVIVDEDGEEIEDFEPVDEELAQRLIPVIRERFDSGGAGSRPE